MEDCPPPSCRKYQEIFSGRFEGFLLVTTDITALSLSVVCSHPSPHLHFTVLVIGPLLLYFPILFQKGFFLGSFNLLFLAYWMYLIKPELWNKWDNKARDNVNCRCHIPPQSRRRHCPRSRRYLFSWIQRLFLFLILEVITLPWGRIQEKKTYKGGKVGKSASEKSF